MAIVLAEISVAAITVVVIQDLTRMVDITTAIPGTPDLTRMVGIIIVTLVIREKIPMVDIIIVIQGIADQILTVATTIVIQVTPVQIRTVVRIIAVVENDAMLHFCRCNICLSLIPSWHELLCYGGICF